MHTLEEARENMLAVIEALPAESLPLAEAAGRILAADCSAAPRPPRRPPRPPAAAVSSAAAPATTIAGGDQGVFKFPIKDIMPVIILDGKDRGKCKDWFFRAKIFLQSTYEGARDLLEQAAKHETTVTIDSKSGDPPVNLKLNEFVYTFLTMKT